MKVIGIIGAMDEEVDILKKKMKVDEVKVMATMEFNSGMLEGKRVVIVRSGIGKVNAAICTQILVNVFGVGVVINTGIAGSLKNEINIGDIVVSTDTLQHDVDASGFGYELGVIPRMDSSVFEADKDLIQLAKESCEEVNKDILVFTGRIVSGDQFISDKDKKKFIRDNFKAYCTEMEGSAIAQTAKLNDVPFVIIRAISDKADDSAHVDYGEFEAKAIEHTVNLVEKMLTKI